MKTKVEQIIDGETHVVYVSDAPSYNVTIAYKLKGFDLDDARMHINKEHCGKFLLPFGEVPSDEHRAAHWQVNCGHHGQIRVEIDPKTGKPKPTHLFFDGVKYKIS